MAFCANCGSQVADGVAFCPNCGKAVGAPTGAAGAGAAAAVQPTPQAPPPVYTNSNASAAPLEENIAGMLAYITIIPAIIFLVMEPYNKNRFIRFHAWQCLFFAGALFVLHVGLSIFAFVPFVALITFPLHLLVSLGGFIIWIVLLMKANQGQMYKLPIIGDLAEKQANAM